MKFFLIFLEKTKEFFIVTGVLALIAGYSYLTMRISFAFGKTPEQRGYISMCMIGGFIAGIIILALGIFLIKFAVEYFSKKWAETREEVEVIPARDPRKTDMIELQARVQAELNESRAMDAVLIARFLLSHNEDKRLLETIAGCLIKMSASDLTKIVANLSVREKKLVRVEQVEDAPVGRYEIAKRGRAP